MRVIFTVSTVLCLLLSGCGAAASYPINYSGVVPGQVSSVQVGGTLYGIKMAMAEMPGTFIMTKNDAVIFFWNLGKQGWAFVAVDASKLISIKNFVKVTGGQASLINAKTITDLRTCLEQNGWKVSPAAEVPMAIKTALAAPTSWLVSMASSMTTFLFVPLVIDSTVPVLPASEQMTS